MNTDTATTPAAPKRVRPVPPGLEIPPPKVRPATPLIRSASEIPSLIQRGHRVLVEHYRYQHCMDTLLIPSWEIAEHGHCCATGGMTRVTVIPLASIPGQGSLFQARVRCSKKDNFCRKEGINRALKLIADQMAIAGVPEYYRPCLWKQMPELNPAHPDAKR